MYDEGLAERLSLLLRDEPRLVEKKMFGGFGLMIRGNIACGVIGDSLIVRVGPDAYGEAVRQPHARPFDFTGRPMKGWVFVDPDGFADDEDLAAWVARGVAFAKSLPAK